MFNSDDKIVSISFDNKKFLDEVQNTINALERLNDATSGKNLKTNGIENLTGAFTNLSRSATSNIDSINRAVNDTSSYSKLSNSVEESGRSFSALEIVAVGALMNIGGAVVNLGGRIASSLTSGIRDGWGEYNLLMDSTQTILANTQRYGTTMGDVTTALDELNTYADKTIYNFSQMTRNIGYFTTAGQNLEDSVMAIKGMSNLGAFFGANNENVARATYQMSQAMSSGLVKLMDWKSLENASMAGAALQDELINTAAVMSGMSVDAFKEYIGYSKGFRNTLEANWLTADVFRETLRKFAGESREYWESLTASNGERLYSDEEIDRIMRLGETAEEAATKVRTFRMMIESLSESIGSGWAETFRILIGDLEQAKEFWTPINDLLAGENGIISGIGQWRNTILKAWADVYRDISVNDLMVGLTAIGDVFKAIGNGITSAFGSTDEIADRLGKITEAIGDFMYVLRLDEEELQDVSDLVQGLLAPFMLLGDIINELTLGLFNSTRRFNDLSNSGNSVADKLRPMRKGILDILGTIGRLLTQGYELYRQTDAVRKALNFLGNAIKTIVGIVNTVLGKAFAFLYNLWNKYDMTNRIIQFYNTFASYMYAIGGILYNTGVILSDWFAELKIGLATIDLNPIKDIKDILYALKEVFISIIDPSISFTEAFSNLKNVIVNSSIWSAIDLIREKIVLLFSSIAPEGAAIRINNLFAVMLVISDAIKDVANRAISGLSNIKKYLKNTNIFGFLVKIKDVIVSLYDGLRSTAIGSVLGTIISSISDFTVSLIDTLNSTSFGDAISGFINRIKGLFETNIQLKTPNVITSITNISGNIKNATSKFVDLKPFNDKLSTVRTVVTNVKDTIAEFIPTGKYASDGKNVVKDLIDVIAPIGENSDKIEKHIKGVAKAFDTVAEIDADKAQENTKKIAMVIATFVAVFKWLADTAITFIAVLSVLNFSKWGSAITSGLTGLAAATAGGLTAMAYSIQIAVSAISGAVSSIGNAVKEQAKAEEFKAVADIFKTVAILVGIIFAGIVVISQFGDPEAFITTMGAFSVHLVMILLAIGGMVTMVILAAGEINKKAAELKVSTFKTMLSITLILWTIQGLLTRAILLITSISAVAMKVSTLDTNGQDIFFRAMDSMAKIFLAIMISVTVMMGVLVGLSKLVSTVDVSSLLGTKTIATISASTMALRGIISALTFMFIGLAAAIAIIVRATPNKELLETAVKTIQWFTRILLVFVAVITFLSAISDSFLIDGLMKARALLNAATLNFTLFAVALVGIVLAFGFVANSLILSITGLVTVLNSLSHTTRIINNVKQIMNSIIVFIGVLSLILITIAALSQNIQSWVSSVSIAATLLSFAGSIWIVSESILVMATAITELASIAELVGKLNVETAFKALRGMIVIVSLIMAMFIGLGTQVALAVPAVTMVILGAGALYLAAHALVLMASAIALVAASASSSTKIKTAADGLAKLLKTFTLFFGILTTILSLLSVVRAGLDKDGNLNGKFGLLGDENSQIETIMGAIAAAMISMGSAAAIAAYGLSLLVKAGTASEIKEATEGVSKIMGVVGTIFGIVATVLSVLAAIPATSAAGTLVTGVLTALALGLAAIGASIALAGYGMKAGAEGIRTYAQALLLLETVDTQKVKNSLTVFSETLPDILHNIINTMPLIEEAISAFLVSLSTSIIKGIVAFVTILYTTLVTTQSGVIAMIGGILIGIIDGVLVILADFLKRICGEGGRLWEVLEPLGQFLVKAAEYIGYYGVRIAIAFIKGIAEALSDSHAIELVAFGLYTLWTGAKAILYNSLGVNNIKDAGRVVGEAFFAGIYEVMATYADPLLAVTEGLEVVTGGADWATHLRQSMQDMIDGYNDLADTHYDEIDNVFDTSGVEYGRDLDEWAQRQDALNALLDGEEELNRRVVSAQSPYDPSEYYALLMHGREKGYSYHNAAGEAEETVGILGLIQNALGSLFNTTQEGASLFGNGGIFGTIFGGLFGDNDEAFGLPSAITDVTDGFEIGGEEAGSGWVDGFTSSLENATPDIEGTINDATVSNVDYGKFSNAVSDAVSLPEEAKNPVISPVLDDTKFWSDFGQFENTWNEKTYDQFAIDADSSMLLREQAQGDATTNGDVTYSFTQINNSPKELSPIQLYRDGKNLLRGSGTFRVT